MVNANQDYFNISQSTLEGYHALFFLDINNWRGGILSCIKSSTPPVCLSFGIFYESIQALPFEINLRDQRCLLISVYFPSPKNSEFS